MSDLLIDSSEQFVSHIETPPSLVNHIGSPQGDFIALLNETSLNINIQVQEIKSTILDAQGPSGPPGQEESMKYDEQIDFVGEDVIYQGEAAPGSAIDAPVWRISKTTFAGEDLSKKWAAGAGFSVRWSDRYSLSY